MALDDILDTARSGTSREVDSEAVNIVADLNLVEETLNDSGLSNTRVTNKENLRVSLKKNVNKVLVSDSVNSLNEDLMELFVAIESHGLTGYLILPRSPVPVLVKVNMVLVDSVRVREH